MHFFDFSLLLSFTIDYFYGGLKVGRGISSQYYHYVEYLGGSPTNLYDLINKTSHSTAI